MKKLILLAITISLSAQAFSDQYVKGYVKKDGTYVQPHLRSSPNNVKFDNYSSSDNKNPYTGKKGYKYDEMDSEYYDLDHNNSTYDN